MDRRPDLMALVSEHGQCRWSEAIHGASYDKVHERQQRQEAADLYAEIESAHAALIAENARLRTALTQLMRHFPTDTDMAEAGWAQHEINEACDAHDAARSALSDNPAQEVQRG